MVELKIVKTREEREEVYRLRYRVFAEEMKFVNPVYFPERMLFDPYDEMEKTAIFAAVVKGEVVGTIRIIRDVPTGLPMDSYMDFTKLRSNFQIAECSRLLTAPEYRRKNIDYILMGLVKIGFIWSVQQGIDYIAITANQNVAQSFFQKLGFMPISEPVNLPEFNDPKALPMGLELREILEPARSFIQKESKNIKPPYDSIDPNYFS